MEDTVANRYAESLFALALEENAIDSYVTDMRLIDTVLESDPSIVSFFSHVVIEDQVKYDLIEKAFKNQVNVYVLNFLKLLIRKRRIRYIREIVKSFIRLCNKHLGIEEGLVYTAFTLSDKQLEDIEKAMSKKENKKIVLRQIRDESLIGGIKVQIENRVYDNSVKNKVEKLKANLLESR